MYLKLYDKIMNSKFKIIITFFRAIFLIIIVSFIIIICAIVYSGLKKDNPHGKYIIILGAKVNNETPSLALTQRLNAAIPVIKNNPNMKIVVSGGQGQGESIAEASAMQKYLIQNGIDKKRILIENRSSNTMENLMYSKLIIQKDNKQSVKNTSVTIVTSNFHILRAKMLAKRVGFNPYMIPAPIHPATIPASYFREYFGVIKSYFLDKPERYDIKF